MSAVHLYDDMTERIQISFSTPFLDFNSPAHISASDFKEILQRKHIFLFTKLYDNSIIRSWT